jgi:hypothetical protein
VILGFIVGHLCCAGVGLTPRQRGKERNQGLGIGWSKRRVQRRRPRGLLIGRATWDRLLGRRD